MTDEKPLRYIVAVSPSFLHENPAGAIQVAQEDLARQIRKTAARGAVIGVGGVVGFPNT